MVLGFLTRLLPHLNQTMTTGWQPPAKVSQPASLKPSPVDSFNREKISPKPLSFSGTPLPEPPRSSFLSRLMSHSAAMSNFPEAIIVEEAEMIDDNFVGDSATKLTGVELCLITAGWPCKGHSKLRWGRTNRRDHRTQRIQESSLLGWTQMRPPFSGGSGV